MNAPSTAVAGEPEASKKSKNSGGAKRRARARKGEKIAAIAAEGASPRKWRESARARKGEKK